MNPKLIFPSFLSVFLLCCFSFAGIAQEINDIKGKYVIVLNMQDHFTQKVLDANTSAQVIENVNAVIDMAESEKIIYIQSILSTLTISLKGKQVDTLPNLEFDERLKIVNQNIFKKSKPNAFASKELVDFLEKKGAKDIVVIGLMAGHCVYHTCFEGKKLGFNMFIVPDAVAGKTDANKDKVLKKLIKKGIKTITL